MADNKTNCYKVPNSSTGVIRPSTPIIKNQTAPKKTTGGDLRSK